MKYRLAWTFVSLLTAVSVLFGFGVIAAFLFFLEHYQIPQDGMSPTLPSGTHLISLRRPYASVSEVKRGDIVVFVHSSQGRPYHAVWRVIALPGDLVEFKDHELFMNGVSLAGQVIRSDEDRILFREQLGETSYTVAYDKRPEKLRSKAGVVQIPKGQLYVLGDNRDHAYDSSDYGPILFSSVVGKVLKWW